MHIKYLKLHNFKSHKDTLIEFDKITSIIGTNAQGKTNLTMALKIIAQHDSWPEKYIRWGQKEAYIEIGLADGSVIRRTRTLKNQTISIKELNQPVKVYDGVKDCESFVRKILGFNTICLVPGEIEEDLNFIGAHAPVRTIFDPPGKVQKQISSLVGSAPIETAKNTLASKLRKNTDTLDLYNQDLVATQEKLDKSSAKLLRLESLSNKAQDLENDIKSAELLKRSLEDFDISLLEIQSYQHHDSLVPNWVNRINRLELSSLESSLNLLKSLKIIQSDLDSNPLLDITNVLKLKDSLELQLKQIDDLWAEHETLADLISLYISNWAFQELEVEEKDAFIEEERNMRLSLDNLLSSLEICPTCNQPVNV